MCVRSNVYSLIFYYVCMTGEAFYHLDSPAVRVTGVDTPMPYTKSLEVIALPQANDVVKAVKTVLNVKS